MQNDEHNSNKISSLSHTSPSENSDPMVNAPPPSWQHQEHAYTSDPMDTNHDRENIDAKVRVYSTSSSIEVEAAAALMSLPTFGSTSSNQEHGTPTTFSSLAAQQQQQARITSASPAAMMYETTPSSSTQPYYYASHGEAYDYQQHGYPSQQQQQQQHEYATTYHQDYASQDPGPRFQFADSTAPRQEQQVLQATHAFRRRPSYCSSTSDSSVGSSSFQPSIGSTSLQPSLGSSSFQQSVGSSSLQHSVGSSSLQHSVGSASFQQQQQQHVAAAASADVSTPRFQFAEAAPRLDMQQAYTYRRKQSYCSSSDSSVSSNDSSCLYENTTGPWFPGNISLALDEDEEVLSPLHCFMRKYCVEAFSATPEDVATPRYGKAHGGKIVVGQVGIRCCHCKHKPLQQRPERAVCFPSSLKNIYHSIETWQRRHSIVCVDLPDWIKRDLTELMQSSRSSAGGRRQYWQDAAKRLGMVDTPCGIRFTRPPGLLDPNSLAAVDQSLPQHQDMDSSNQPLVNDKDRPLVTDYLFLLMSQMESCKFCEQDRTGGRSKVKLQEVGFPGMQCRHCRGKAGFGRYFPQSAQALALANSDRNIFNHVMKCRKCPDEIKEQLLKLQQEQQSGPKNKRGSRKLFFTRIWERLHSGSEQQAGVAATADSIASAWFGTNI